MVGKLECLFQGSGLGDGIWRPCPDYILSTLSALATRSKGIQSIISGVGLVAGVAGRLSVLTVNRLQGSTLSHLSGFTSINFSMFRYI